MSFPHGNASSKAIDSRNWRTQIVAKFSCIETTIDISSLDLGRSLLCNGSRARSFYMYLMNMHACGKVNGHNDLVSRIRETCDKHNVSFVKYVFNKNYASHVRQNILRISPDGLSDSVRQLIISHEPYDRVLLRMLLIAF